MALSKIVENSIATGAVAASKLKDFTAAVDLNGVELILDADQDTSITADTDDQIDIKISGADDFQIYCKHIYCFSRKWYRSTRWRPIL